MRNTIQTREDLNQANGISELQEEAIKETNNTKEIIKDSEETNEKIIKLKKKEIESFLEIIKKEGIIDFDKIKKIGGGGTHDVFLSDKSNKFVLKINRKIYEIIKQTSLNGKVPDNIYSEAKKIINNRNNEYNGLYDDFGLGNCLYENMRMEKIKINNQTTECPITVQEKTDIFSSEYIDITSDDIYISPGKNNTIPFQNLNEMVLGNSNNISQEELSKSITNFLPHFQDIFDKIDEDPLFKKELINFLTRFQKYYNSKGNIIDLCGKKNIIMFLKNNKREFKLGSVIKKETKETFIELLEKLEDKDLSQENVNILKQCLTVTRIVNSLGISLGIGKIIDLSLNSKQIQSLNTLEAENKMTSNSSKKQTEEKESNIMQNNEENNTNEYVGEKINEIKKFYNNQTKVINDFSYKQLKDGLGDYVNTNASEFNKNVEKIIDVIRELTERTGENIYGIIGNDGSLHLINDIDTGHYIIPKNLIEEGDVSLFFKNIEGKIDIIKEKKEKINNLESFDSYSNKLIQIGDNIPLELNQINKSKISIKDLSEHDKGEILRYLSGENYMTKGEFTLENIKNAQSFFSELNAISENDKKELLKELKLYFGEKGNNQQLVNNRSTKAEILEIDLDLIDITEKIENLKKEGKEKDKECQEYIMDTKELKKKKELILNNDKLCELIENGQYNTLEFKKTLFENVYFLKDGKDIDLNNDIEVSLDEDRKIIVIKTKNLYSRKLSFNPDENIINHQNLTRFIEGETTKQIEEQSANLKKFLEDNGEEKAKEHIKEQVIEKRLLETSRKELDDDEKKIFNDLFAMGGGAPLSPEALNTNNLPNAYFEEDYHFNNQEMVIEYLKNNARKILLEKTGKNNLNEEEEKILDHIFSLKNNIENNTLEGIKKEVINNWLKNNGKSQLEDEERKIIDKMFTMGGQSPNIPDKEQKGIENPLKIGDYHLITMLDSDLEKLQFKFKGVDDAFENFYEGTVSHEFQHQLNKEYKTNLINLGTHEKRDNKFEKQLFFNTKDELIAHMRNTLKDDGTINFDGIEKNLTKKRGKDTEWGYTQLFEKEEKMDIFKGKVNDYINFVKSIFNQEEFNKLNKQERIIYMNNIRDKLYSGNGKSTIKIENI